MHINHVDSAEAFHHLRQKDSATLARLAQHFEAVAPLATVPANRRDSEALSLACRRILQDRA